MCGICLLIRQKIASAAQAASDGGKSKGGATSTAHRSPHAALPASTSATTTLPVDNQNDPHEDALRPSSADAHSLTPCMCAQAGLEVKRFLSSADVGNELFTELLHNLRRRGPDTYGVTRRSFVTSCHAPADRHIASLLSATAIASNGDDDEEEHDHSANVSSGAARVDPHSTLTLRTEVAGVASVLGLRGHSTVAQPYDMNVAADAEDDRQANSWDHRSSLMWNGEIFGGALCPPPWGSDTVLLATRLSQMELECVHLTQGGGGGGGRRERAAGDEGKPPLMPLVERQRIFLRKCTTLFEQQVEGPYSFIFIATRLRLAVFGRDPLGRHSLLTHVRVTRPCNAAGAAAEELDVELIVTSVGVQHHQAGQCKAEEGEEEGKVLMAADGKSSTKPLSLMQNEEREKDEERQEEGAAPLSTSSALICEGQHTVSSPSSSKRPRHERRSGADKSLAPTTVTTTAEAGDEEAEDGNAGGVPGGDHALDVCWQEVGVTGLFAVPLQTPLIYAKDSHTAAPTQQKDDEHHDRDGDSDDAEGSMAAEEKGTGTVDRLHPVCATGHDAAHVAGACGAHKHGSSSTTHRNTGGSTAAPMLCGAHVLLLHCPWQRTHHLVHPLLRTATLAMIPHEPPSFELILAHEEIAVLPEPLLRWASHLMKSMQPGGGLDQSWVDWAAAHYMLALAVSMHRRITVANSGAADGRDAQELSTARRRPLCILFSGGIDCTVIAALAHYILPVETPIELVNVAFGDNPEEAPDRVAAFRSMEELLRLPLLSTSRGSGGDGDAGAATPEREWRLVLVDVPSKATADTAHIKDLLVPRHTVMDLDIGTALWYAARASGRMQILKRSDVDGVAQIAGDSFDGTPPMTAPASPTSATAGLRLGSGSPTVTLDGFSKHFRAYTGATAVNSAMPWEATTAEAPTFPSSTNATNATTTTTGVAGKLKKTVAVAAGVPSSAPRDGVSAAPSAPVPTPPSSQVASAPSSTSQSSEEVANVQKYQILVDVLVKEGRSGGGPTTPVLLSTLGKEYSLFLQPHIKRYGYKKLGSFLNDAAKAGYIKFAADAPSKAVRLCRPCDMERAAAVPPSPWFTTAAMKRAQDAPYTPAGGVTHPHLHSQQQQPVLPSPGTYFDRYTSHAKVVLLGMGADETLGGYTRYRRFFQREGMSGAQRELERDFARLWQRNLGRDDRVTMDSGREPRFPFLDEGVLRTLEWIVLKRRNNILVAHDQLVQSSNAHSSGVNGVLSGSPTTMLSSLSTFAGATGPSLRGPAHRDVGPPAVPPLTQEELLRLALEPIVSFRLQPGEGDKRVLRRVASVLGLSDVTHLQKRAIQFGSRIAERKIKGTTDF